MTRDLTDRTAVAFLEAEGLLEPDAEPVQQSLGGGVSNRVRRVETTTDRYVLKQPLENLAVEDDWPADVVRVHNEAAAARAYGRICESVPGAAVPSVLAESRSDHVVVFSCAPATSVDWKRDLLEGRVDERVAAIVGRILGAVHAEAAGDEALRAEFADETPFRQLRLDPYHRTTAERYPAVADEIHAEIERIRDVERTLVHGDYSPKNVLVAPDEDGDGEPTVWILDFEVAHWGDPAFDAAFMLNHLFIKSVYNSEQMSAYHGAARTFWDVYDGRVPWDVEAQTVRELAVLMLARIDGKSPVEYVEREAVADALRAVATRALTSDVTRLDTFREIVVEEAVAP